MEKQLRVQGGTLLAAWPDMLDPNFMHSVVLVCQHDDDGAYGLVTNQRTEFPIDELLPDQESLEGCGFPVHLGGPVDHSTLQFVHSVPERVPDGMPIGDDLWLGGDFDALVEYLATERVRAERSVRLFLGYSGWGAGQLDAELATGSWLWAPPALEAVFGPVGESTWRRVVRRSGEAGEDLENHPPDVSWN